MTGSNFNASAAGRGTHTITYSYMNASGCSANVSKTIEVYPLPVVSFSGLNSSYCTTNPAVTLSGNPAGGTFSGTGVAGNTFNPAAAGAGGPYTILYTYTNANGCSNSSSQQVTVNVCTSTITVNLKLFLQGYYISAGTMQPVLSNQLVPQALPTQTDSITIELNHAITRALIDSRKVILMTNGTASTTFNQPQGVYYVSIGHRNSIRTWSASTIECTASTPLYDFSSAAVKAFGSNQVQVENGVWALYTGDINQDEYIDGNDFPLYDLDSYHGVNGLYKATDLNGDGYVDGNDFPILDLNSSQGISVIAP